jgi:hypothetical protein
VNKNQIPEKGIKERSSWKESPLPLSKQDLVSYYTSNLHDFAFCSWNRINAGVPAQKPRFHSLLSLQYLLKLKLFRMSWLIRSVA